MTSRTYKNIHNTKPYEKRNLKSKCDPQVQATNDDLEKQALDEIITETKRASMRASELGAHAWAKPRIGRTNRRFLHNTILGTLSSRANTLKTVAIPSKTNETNGNKTENEDQPTSSS